MSNKNLPFFSTGKGINPDPVLCFPAEKTLRHIAELALVRAIPDLTLGTLKPGRLKGLYTRLQKYVDKDLRRLPRLSKRDIKYLEEKINQFGEETGWFKSPRHVGTLLSFCAELIENSDFTFHPRIQETITEIVLFLERGNDLNTACCWAGSVASEKWENIFNRKEVIHA